MGTLRSNFEVGTTRWAVRRTQWLAMGIRPEDFDRPKVAIVNSSSRLSVCYAHLDELALRVAAEVRAAGGLPFEIRTVAPSDFITSAGRSARYLLPSRDLIVNDIEVAVEGALLDGMICLSSCDKTAPAHLMAAGRLNIPSALVIGGYQTGGICQGSEVDIDDVYESVGAVAAGTMSTGALEAMTACALRGPGVCAGLGTANTMHMLAEALGMTAPGSAPVRAGSDAMVSNAVSTVHHLMDLIRNNTRPRDIMTAGAFRNAVMVALAIGASVNAPRHLQAVAVETGVPIDIYGLIEEYGKTVPMVCTVRPNGVHRVPSLENAGGTLAVMKRLEGLLELGELTITGAEWAQVLGPVVIRDESVVQPITVSQPRGPGLALFRGSLAPDGAVVKLAGFPIDVRYFRGPARVFDSEEDAINAIQQKALAKGDVAVLRGLGPKGGPGTVFAAGFVAALNGAGLASSIACVTDGELSGLNRGITIGQVMPEAALGGPLALIEDGDVVEIDVDSRQVNHCVQAETLEKRRASWQPPAPPHTRSWLTQYWHMVQPLSAGAVLGSETS